jgi:hypothetical protein
MKRKILIITFTICSISLFSQQIELSGMYFGSSTNMFKNTFGYGISYNQLFTKSKLGIEISQCVNKTKYDDFYRSLSTADIIAEDIRPNNHRIFFKLKYGLNIVHSQFSNIYIGPNVSLNYFDINEEYYVYNPIIDTKYQRNFSQKSKIGTGFFIDFEFNEIIQKNISIFMSTNMERTNFKTPFVIDDSHYPWGITWLGIQLGIRYNLK